MQPNPYEPPVLPRSLPECIPERRRRVSPVTVVASLIWFIVWAGVLVSLPGDASANKLGMAGVWGIVLITICSPFVAGWALCGFAKGTPKGSWSKALLVLLSVMLFPVLLLYGLALIALWFQFVGW